MALSETDTRTKLIDPALHARGWTLVTSEAQPVAVALIEAKAEDLPATHGLEQAKLDDHARGDRST